MKTSSKFASNTYFGVALLVLFFFLTHFRAQAQVSSEPKDTVLVLKKEKATYVHFPIYIDASIEMTGPFWIGANANAGVYLNRKHAIGLSIFAGGPITLSNYHDMACLGLQYSYNVILKHTLKDLLFYKFEAGKVFHYNRSSGEGLYSYDIKNSQPYYGRISAGIRLLCFNFYAALGSTGKLKANYVDYYGQPQTHSYNFTHFTFGGGLTLPMHKSKKTSASK
ncbi:MAG: hypothetical protein ACOYPR_00370 [Saprospiraceae bacterium]